MTDRPMTDTLARVRARAEARRALSEGDEWEPSPEVEEARARSHEEVKRARWAQAIPARFQWATLGDFGAEADPVRRWVATSGPRPNLVILGPVGTGKTHLAVAACRPDADRGLEVRFFPVIELLDDLRPSGPPGAFHDLADIDRLIVDDLGTERPTDWTGERLGGLINRRWLEERPLVVTTNLTMPELRESIGAPAYSRLVGSGAVVVRLAGDDRRKGGRR